MLCPLCNQILIAITVHTEQHGSFKVDHCGRCGGNWFDRYEINRLAYQEVIRLGSITNSFNNEEIYPKEEFLCPIDHLPLIKFTGSSVPYNITIRRCLKCAGVFVSQKDLLKFKDQQRQKINLLKHLNLPFPTVAAVFIPIFFAGVLLFSTFLTVSKVKESQDNQAKAREMITSVQTVPVNSQTTGIIFITSDPVTASITYWSNPLNKKTIIVSETPKTVHSAILKNLGEETDYKYQITLGLTNNSQTTSSEYSFKTQ
ncbi:MAG: hypothetical protein UT63_C0009G0007 [Candidatus Gottesmanbacteria bacterium GW2011_GWC2_39_8]|uniref:Transcription factor zinc-finger domain-containing protein n=1 Tax=Candidatus Gottesmanbacteria bacterium GW2011_GWC2_39_8 TaxID=1618450 RepID=A0A0G0T7W2_9BACT|nr:MAG: hypothetical protein UT63_C0009G0007 [Candidatus Gottesmanbacteria bacterium GW2011_GWC2_39_8]